MSSGEEIRLALTLHYDGGAFFGWQSQREERTVQGEIEAAIERLTGARRVLIGSGRTDRGVHATGQVAAVSVPARWTAPSFRKALNAILPDDVWACDVQAVPASFHPRYDAVARTYTYRIGLAEEARSPFLRRWCWYVRTSLDRELLEQASARIVGEHSFAAFAKSGQPERGTRCTVHSTLWEPWEGLGLAFTITANRYLHHMVRYLVGTMVEIARGARPLDDLTALLQEGPTPGRETSPPAPARGFYLTMVEYPKHALGEALEGAEKAEKGPMKIFLDTADVAEIRRAADANLIDGITTNPSLMAQAAGKGDPRDIFLEICRTVDGPVSAEVVAVEKDTMVSEGKRLAKIHDNIVVKVPLTEDGLRACRALRAEGIRVNVTLCFSVTQAHLAAKAGATFISPFVGRIDDISGDGMELIGQIRQVYDNYGFETEILAASIRHPQHVVQSLLLGADCATMPSKVLYQLLKHPLTDTGLSAFLADWKKLGKEL